MSAAAGLLGLVHRLVGAIQNQGDDTRVESGSLSAGCADGAPVAVFETCFPLEAEVVRGFLETYDIPASIQQEAISRAYPLTVGDLADIRVLVPEALAPQALELLAEQKAAMAQNAEADRGNSQ